MLLDSERAIGCDISQSGLAARVGASAQLKVGDTVVVTLSPPAATEARIAALAEVVRVAPVPEGFIVGLQFLSGPTVAAQPSASPAVAGDQSN